jgi:excinuclease ABC subunit C
LKNSKEKLKEIVKILPNKPGVYRFYDIDKNIIYIGKAKDLRKRVSSYFAKNHENIKTRILVRKIASISHIIVNNESDALLLENNLIKKYQPRYNVMLKDDKTYPWICIKNEEFPRVFQTRNVIKDGSKYYGPYTSVVMVRTLLELFRKLYPIRNCNLKLNEKNIKANKFKVCLEYHIENCKAPCVGYQTEEEYNIGINHIKEILKGNIGTVIKYLKDLMNDFSTNLKFEKAQAIKNKILSLEKFQSKSTIVSNTIIDVDVFSISDDEKYAFVNYLKVVNGAIIHAHTVEVKKKLNETKQELLPRIILEIREKVFSNSHEIIVPFEFDFQIEGLKFIVPKIGDKNKLLDLSTRNVKYFHRDRIKQLENINPEKNSQRKLETMKKDLRLQELPIHIEGFDNSNIQGTNPVASCVVFKNTKPSKKDYRQFKIKTVEGPDDFASMEEVIYRRYSRLLIENQSLPQLIVVDGGKGQLNSAVKTLEKIGLRGKIAIIGIAKKLEEIYFPGDSVPIYLNKNSETLKIIQQIRNESHRFGITFHRNLRSKTFIKSELENIKGIGSKTQEILLKEFKSVKRIKNLSLLDLKSKIDNKKAKIVYNYFNEN